MTILLHLVSAFVCFSLELLIAPTRSCHYSEIFFTHGHLIKESIDTANVSPSKNVMVFIPSIRLADGSTGPLASDIAKKKKNTYPVRLLHLQKVMVEKNHWVHCRKKKLLGHFFFFT